MLTLPQACLPLTWSLSSARALTPERVKCLQTWKRNSHLQLSCSSLPQAPPSGPETDRQRDRGKGGGTDIPQATREIEKSINQDYNIHPGEVQPF